MILKRQKLKQLPLNRGGGAFAAGDDDIDAAASPQDILWLSSLTTTIYIYIYMY